jgi:asparagine synthase (glutamine-hydrolysing)
MGQKRQKAYSLQGHDRLKPLYYYYKDGLFMFASELKAFHKHLRFEKKPNLTGLSLYLKYGYITRTYSIFENAYKLKP